MASNKIKGITIEIGGDTTKLGKAITEANKQAKGLQRELNGVNTLLKHDPKNTELLAQKQELLAKAVSGTKEKLDALKDAQANLTPEQIEADEEGYRNLQREIASTEQKLESLVEEQKNFGSVAAQEIAAAGEQVKEFGEKAESAGKSLLPVTGAIVGLGTAAIKITADFDEAMSQVAALSGATGEDLETLREKAREMGEATKYSATEAADAFSYMALAGWDTEEMLTGIEPILNLATAANMDLGRTSDIVTDYLTAFGLSANDAAHFTDLMAYASANSNTTVADLGEAYKNCAATASSMGYSVEEVTAVLSTMANAGVKGGEAGTALNAVMTRLATDTNGCATALAEYGVAVYDANGNMNSLSSILTGVRQVWNNLNTEQQAGLAKTIAGTSHYSALQTIMGGLSDEMVGAGKSFSDYAQAMTDCDGTAQSMADTMNDNLNGQLTILKSQLQELAISFGEMLMPAIRGIVEAIQGFVDKLNNMSEGQRRAVIAIAAVVAAIGPLLISVGKGIVLIGQVMTFAPKVAAGLTAVKGAITAIGAAMAANPIGLIVTAVAALGVALVAAYNHCESFRNAVNGAFSAIGNAIGTAANAIGGFVTKTIPSAINSAINYISRIPEKTRQLANTLSNTISNTFNKIKTFTATAWRNIGNSISTAMTSAKEKVSAVINEIRSGAISKFSSLYHTVTTTFTSIKNSMIRPINDAKAKIYATITNIKDKVKNIFQGIAPKLNIKLPHVTVEGGKAPFGIGGKGSLPKFKVVWNKLGAIFDQPTIFDTRLGYQGVGEAGPEAVAPIDTLMGYVRTAVDESLSDRLERIEGLMQQYLPEMSNRQIVLDTGVLVGETASKMNAEFGRMGARSRRGW